MAAPSAAKRREAPQKDPHYQRLARAFAWLAAEPGIGRVAEALKDSRQ